MSGLIQWVAVTGTKSDRRVRTGCRFDGGDRCRVFGSAPSTSTGTMGIPLTVSIWTMGFLFYLQFGTARYYILTVQIEKLVRRKLVENNFFKTDSQFFFPSSFLQMYITQSQRTSPFVGFIIGWSPSTGTIVIYRGGFPIKKVTKIIFFEPILRKSLFFWK